MVACACAAAIRAAAPYARIHPVAPATFDDADRSRVSGRRESVLAGGVSIRDAPPAPTPGERTFAVCRHLLPHGPSVDDEAVRAAPRFVFGTLKPALEPGGAVARSGGNVDPPVFAEILAAAPSLRALA